MTKVADNQSELARLINERLIEQGRTAERVSQANVWWWLNRSYKVPSELAEEVAAITGIPKERLLPRVFREDQGVITSS